MSEWRSRWMTWDPDADRTCKTGKTGRAGGFAGFEGSISRARPSPPRKLDAGDIEAVRLTKTVIGDVWLVRDREAAERIAAQSVPIFYFEEVETLRGKTKSELEATAATKRVFPASKVLQ